MITTFDKKYAKIGDGVNNYHETLEFDGLDNGIVGLWGTLNEAG